MWVKIVNCWCWYVCGGGVTSFLCQYLVDGSWSIKGAFLKFYCLSIDYCNHLWFLFTLLFLNCFYPIAEKFVLQKDDKRYNLYYLSCLLVLLTCSQSYFLVGRLHGLKGFLPCSYAYAILGYFILSMKAYVHGKRVAIMVLIISISFQVLHNYLVSIYPFMQRMGSPYDLVFSGYSSIWTILAACSFIYLISQLRLKSNSFINFLSDNTFGIYFIHFIVIRALRCYTNLQQNPIAVFVVTIVITLSLVYIMSRNKYLKRIITT